jgi:hypothetical protein
MAVWKLVHELMRYSANASKAAESSAVALYESRKKTRCAVALSTMD